MEYSRKKLDQFIAPFVVKPGKKVSLAKDFDPGYVDGVRDKEHAKTKLVEGVELLSEFQDKLYAQNRYALLLIFQAMDAAGKDGCIKHVMSGINPQGCQVYSFKAPSTEELDHDFLWRSFKTLPERGRIGIFNRSYYEETLVVRVHPEFLEKQHLPPDRINDGIWKRRFRQINHFEEYLVDNGIVVLKFFLNVSKAEQKRRFLERIDRPEKNWKFSAADVQERGHWKEYMAAYEDVFNRTSSAHAPWHVIPADHKWFARLAVSAVILRKLMSLDLHYPEVGEAQKKILKKARQALESEK
ncbi:MAG: polyphosphate kinase 2 family protein [Verrucomicrobiae bacterium]|nr:polyphosphate kinase 2 family protein [Verrucomicrobiae bacterium]